MTDLSLTLNRLIDAPPAKVWRCWTDPAILPRWFGPEGYSCQTKEIDLRPGGLWRFDMIGPDGKVWANRHRITLYDMPQRIEFLLDGDDDTVPPMEVTVTLTPEGTGTWLVQRMVFPNNEMLQGAVAFGAERLGYTTLDKLARMAEAI